MTFPEDTPFFLVNLGSIFIINQYGFLLQNAFFKETYISLNGRRSFPESGYPMNGNAILLLFQSSFLSNKVGGETNPSALRPSNHEIRQPQNEMIIRSRHICHCEAPYISSTCNRITYLYLKKNLQTYPRTLRGTEEWNNTYKIKANVEKSINHFKGRFCADKLHKFQYISGLKLLTA